MPRLLYMPNTYTYRLRQLRVVFLESLLSNAVYNIYPLFCCFPFWLYCSAFYASLHVDRVGCLVWIGSYERRRIGRIPRVGLALITSPLMWDVLHLATFPKADHLPVPRNNLSPM